LQYCRLSLLFKKKNLLFAIVGSYLLLILILNIYYSIRLKNDGVYVSAKITKVSKTIKSYDYIYFEFYHKGKLHNANISVIFPDKLPKVGDYYLVKYLEDKQHINYLFLDIKIDDKDVYSDISKYITEDLSIYFWNM
jgi:hypothetical protein